MKFEWYNSLFNKSTDFYNNYIDHYLLYVPRRFDLGDWSIIPKWYNFSKDKDYEQFFNKVGCGFCRAALLASPVVVGKYRNSIKFHLLSVETARRNAFRVMAGCSLAGATYCALVFAFANHSFPPTDGYLNHMGAGVATALCFLPYLHRCLRYNRYLTFFFIPTAGAVGALIKHECYYPSSGVERYAMYRQATHWKGVPCGKGDLEKRRVSEQALETKSKRIQHELNLDFIKTHGKTIQAIRDKRDED